MLMLSEVLQTVTRLLEQFVLMFGTVGIGAVAFFENLFPPTPSEFLYPLAGKLIYDGRLTLGGVLLAGVTGSVCASYGYYSLGRWLGAERTRGLIERYGRLNLLGRRLPLVTVKDFDHAMRLFESRGNAVVMFARLLPFVHSIISVPAGVARMPRLPFLLYTAVGSVLWIAPLTLLGAWLGSHWRDLLSLIDTYSIVVYGALALLIVRFLARRVAAQSA